MKRPPPNLWRTFFLHIPYKAKIDYDYPFRGRFYFDTILLPLWRGEEFTEKSHFFYKILEISLPQCGLNEGILRDLTLWVILLGPLILFYILAILTKLGSECTAFTFYILAISTKSGSECTVTLIQKCYEYFINEFIYQLDIFYAMRMLERKKRNGTNRDR